MHCSVELEGGPGREFLATKLSYFTNLEVGPFTEKTGFSQRDRASHGEAGPVTKWEGLSQGCLASHSKNFTLTERLGPGQKIKIGSFQALMRSFLGLHARATDAPHQFLDE